MPLRIISCSKFDLLEVLTPIIQDNASFRAIDCRLIGNPYHNPTLRELTGMDAAVQNDCMSTPLFRDLIDRIVEDMLSKEFKTLVAWCFGGRHRSVALAEITARRLLMCGQHAEIDHLTLKRRGLATPAKEQ